MPSSELLPQLQTDQDGNPERAPCSREQSTSGVGD